MIRPDVLGMVERMRGAVRGSQDSHIGIPDSSQVSGN